MILVYIDETSLWLTIVKPEATHYENGTATKVLPPAVLNHELISPHARHEQVHYPPWRVLGHADEEMPSFFLDVDRKFSYSQDNEDVYLHNFFFCHKFNGTFLELGALDGVTYSNTKGFEDYFGWRGTLIEANPIAFDRLLQNRNGGFSILIQSAVCDSFRTVHYVESSENLAVGGILEFMSPIYREAWHSGINIYSPGVHKVACHSLTDLLRIAGIPHYDFLSLDVEGGELEVLQSLDFAAFSFSVILVEADASSPQREAEIRKLLTRNGFVFKGTLQRSDWFVHESFTPKPCVEGKEAPFEMPAARPTLTSSEPGPETEPRRDIDEESEL